MKRLSLIVLMGLLLTACAPAATPVTGPSEADLEATVNARVAGTVEALPTSTPWPTNTPWPTYTPVPKPTNTPRPTAAPRPTATPEPELGTRLSPFPYGSIADLVQGGELEFQVSVADVKRGDKAWNFIYAANQFNDAPPADMEYIVATVVITYTGGDKGTLQMDRRDWAVVTNGQVIEFSAIPSVCCIQGELEDLKVFSGGKAKGLMVWPVYLDDPNPLLVLSMKSDGTGGLYFATAP